MTETQQTTAERIAEDMGVPLGSAQTVAAELDVHHRTYERLGQEQEYDLTVLCHRCHSLFHSVGRI